MSTVEERSYIEAARREKRAALEALGVRPFAYRYERTHTAAQALAAYQDDMGDSGPQVRVAGRLDRFGSHGKTAFGHLEDPSGRIQIYFRRDALGPCARALPNGIRPPLQIHRRSGRQIG